MLVCLLMLTTSSNAATSNNSKSILYSKTTGIGFILSSYIIYNCLHIKFLEGSIALYAGMFNISSLTHGLNIFILLITVIILFLTAFYPRKYKQGSLLLGTDSIGNEFILNKKSNQFNIIEYSLIITFIVCGATLLMSSADIISIFLSIELQSYGLYILSTLYRDSESATSSGLTYFLLGGLSSCFILLGSGLLYVNSGTTVIDYLSLIYNIESNLSYWYESYYIDFALIVLATGFLFKVSAAPFHFWSPDVYDGIPTVVTTFVAIVAKISIFTILLVLVSNISNNIYGNYNVEDMLNSYKHILGVETWRDVFAYSSLMSLVVGSILGLTQYRIKRLFAYSTISHVGFILLALSVNNLESIQAYIFYILQYSISNLNAFFILVSMAYTLYMYVYVSDTFNNKNTLNWQNLKLTDVYNSPIQLISQLKGYFHINSFISLSFAITIFSFVGIPPLIGFFAKQMVLSSALDKGYVFITLVGVVTSVIGAVYYLNLVKVMFFEESVYKTANVSLNIPSYYNGEKIEVNNNKLYKDSLHNDLNNNRVSETVNASNINGSLSITISVLTSLIISFILIPGEWFRIASILSLSVYNV